MQPNENSSSSARASKPEVNGSYSIPTTLLPSSTESPRDFIERALERAGVEDPKRLVRSVEETAATAKACAAAYADHVRSRYGISEPFAEDGPEVVVVKWNVSPPRIVRYPALSGRIEM